MNRQEYSNGLFSIQDLNWSLTSYRCKLGLDSQENINKETAQEPKWKICIIKYKEAWKDPGKC